MQPKHDWDAVLMVLLDYEFNALEIYEEQPRTALAKGCH
jgi:hypothetical protein